MRAEIADIIWDGLHPLARVASHREDIEKIAELIILKEMEDADSRRDTDS